MDGLREQLIYKNVPVSICMKDLKPIEHYEVVRLILASKSNTVSVCSHDCVNSYIQAIFKKLSINSYLCLNQGGNLRFPPASGSGDDSSSTFGETVPS